MLLLFAPLGQEPPLRNASFRTIRQMLEMMGQAMDPDREVDLEELRRLGMDERTAERILRRLGMETELEKLLDTLSRLHITAITRISPAYPGRLREKLGDRAPMVLYCAGNLDLLYKRGIALVGSRKLREPGARFARTAGEQIAAQGYVYVSGGAAGADTEGFHAAVQNGGAGLLFLADSLQGAMADYEAELRENRVALVSEDGYNAGFSIARAYARNRLIHAMGELVLVAQSDYGAGGTWQGTMENLKYDWSPVYVSNLEPEDPGSRGLLERGCQSVCLEELADLDSLQQTQTVLY